ncbi:MAG: LCP family protein [Ilumatobacteraceae bacterium]|nr:LCP family protein [Ilumatobacteraceae bacterium]
MATSKPRRTWPQRLTFVTVIVASLACFATAAGLAAGQWVLSQRRLVDIDPVDPATLNASGDGPTIILPGATTTLPSDAGAPTTSIVLAEPDAANFLVVGSDNGGCSDQIGTGDRDDLGERSDTIMVWRANPETNQLAVLSFPRDLYVDIGGRRDRINTAYRRDDPTRLIETIAANFGVPVDHYVQVDFCAFRELVNSVGGVEVPFAMPARDRRSGLAVPTTGCVNLEGDMALAYVRSRHYEYEDPAGSGNWEQDGTSDFGRIARQQDFLRRVVAKVINDGLTSPSVASALITTNRKYLVTDTGLTVNRMLEFANTLRRLDPADITTYRIESSSETLSNGDKVERPRIGGSNMQAILSVFSGQARLADAPDQVFATTTTAAPRTTTTTSPDNGSSADETTEDTTDESVTTTTLPVIEAEENTVGIVPDRDSICN